MKHTKEIQRKLWDVELEILDVIDNVCRTNNLKYSISFGTMLGAVRHKGFIPWDDDIDIMMPINDYNVLLDIWSDVAPRGYVLQNNITNPDFPQIITKIRKDHTTFIESEGHKTKTFHKGIYVDISPVCRVAPGKISRKLQIAASAIYLLYARDFPSKSGPIMRICEKVLLSFPKVFKKHIYHVAEKYIKKWSGRTDCNLYIPETIRGVFRVYPGNMFDELQEIEFEGRKYLCVKDTDMVLKLVYKNYMQLPPEEERVWKHKALILDFEHNYEELEER